MEKKMQQAATIKTVKTIENWALVTGASSGIGLAYCELLASQGRPLILVARSGDKLTELAQQLRDQYAIETRVIVADLSCVEGIEQVLKQSDDLSVKLLINNAGREESGDFLSLASEQLLGSIALNCSAPMLLSHHFGQRMAASGGGQILFLASIVAFQGVPVIANYAATKAYLLTLAEGLACELEAHKVEISIAAPGFTESNLAPNQDFSQVPIKPLSAEFVANYTLQKLGKQRLIIPGAINKFLFYTGKYLQSRRLNSRAFGKVFSTVLHNKLQAQTNAKQTQQVQV